MQSRFLDDLFDPPAFRIANRDAASLDEEIAAVPTKSDGPGAAEVMLQ